MTDLTRRALIVGAVLAPIANKLGGAPMSGNPPVLALSSDQPSYKPGATAAVTLVITDADNTSETLTTTGTDAEGLEVTEVETTTRKDSHSVRWTVDGTAQPAANDQLQLLVPIPTTAKAGVQIVVTATVTDRQKNTASKDLALAVTAPAIAPMLIGVVCPPKPTADNAYGYQEHIAALGPARCQLLGQYNSPGGKLKAWSAGSWPSASDIPGGFIAVVRMKDYPDPAWAQGWADSIPAHIKEVWWCHRHEIQPGETYVDGTAVTPERYKSAWAVMDQIRQASANRYKIKLVPIFMQYQLDQGMDPALWWPAQADYFGNDCYSNEGSFAGYRPLTDLFADTFKYAKQFNRPAALMEWGAQCDSGKPGQTDAIRSSWILDGLDMLDAARFPDGRRLVAAVTWWSSLSTNTTNGIRNDFRLPLPGAELSLGTYKHWSPA